MVDITCELINKILLGLVVKLLFVAVPLLFIFLAIYYPEIPIICVVLLLVLLDAYLCLILYKAIYTETPAYSKIEVGKGKPDTSIKNESKYNFSLKIIAKTSNAFSYPIGISIIVLTVGIVTIVVMCIVLKTTKCFYLT